MALVLQGDVELLEDGTAQVFSQSNGVTSYHLVNGVCTCEDYPRAPHQFCKHRIAAGIARRAGELLSQPPVLETATAPDPTRPRRTIPAKYIQQLQGKDFVRALPGYFRRPRPRGSWP